MPRFKRQRRVTSYALICLMALALVAQAGLLIWTLAG